jgi:hypothetical protein
VVRRPTLVRTDDGREVVSNATIYVAGDQSITAEDQVTLPDGTTPPILTVYSYPDDEGIHHQKVMI